MRSNGRATPSAPPRRPSPRAGTRGTRIRSSPGRGSNAPRPFSTGGRRRGRRRSSSPSAHGSLMINYQYETSLPAGGRGDPAGTRGRRRADRSRRDRDERLLEGDAGRPAAHGAVRAGARPRRPSRSRRVARIYEPGFAWSLFGDLRRASEVSVRGIAMAERDGDEQCAAFMRGNLMGPSSSGASGMRRH